MKVYILKINIFSVSSKPGENRGKHLGEFEGRSVVTRDAVDGFICSRILTLNVRLGFHQAIEGTTNMFYFFSKIIIFRFNNESTINEGRMYHFIFCMKL